ncbi:hypothetical protein F3J23_15040 [Chryseobacterium sp. Tr-659]|uniref:hypothetical protein n=1 Tax=Chryseobacterium sp. Tr-659 TaxID=2608340 RepID=UPI00142236A7|nr:hypothetical protein [Chryseobacterium sp. Tr-659]NIF06761.1 hypothetical protein [Chryseobacterium sp. Tr-659]
MKTRKAQRICAITIKGKTFLQFTLSSKNPYIGNCNNPATNRKGEIFSLNKLPVILKGKRTKNGQ